MAAPAFFNLRVNHIQNPVGYAMKRQFEAYVNGEKLGREYLLRYFRPPKNFETFCRIFNIFEVKRILLLQNGQETSPQIQRVLVGNKTR